MASYTDFGGWTVDFTYDAADRPTQLTYPDGTSDQYAYNLLDLAVYTNRGGQTWSFAHDADRRLVAVTDPNGNKTRLAYYENDRLKSLTDANGNTTSWAIDDESRPTAKQFADGTTIGYTWDNTISLLASMTDARGESRNYGYALDNRLASITYANTLNPTSNVSFRWDPYFPLLVAMRDGGGATTYVYYAAGFIGALRVKTETGPYAAIGYAYDALGRLASRTVGSAASETFGYDPIGRLASHGTALGTFDYGYLGETGQPTSRQLVGGGGIATNWSYRSNLGDRRLASITNTPGRSFAYTTTPTDLITGIAETPSPPGQNWSFSYDGANRLTLGQSPSEGTYPYTLDPVGNITVFGSTAAAYNSVNELTSLGGAAYASDADGNLTSDTARSYAWDAENRLVGVGYTAQPGTSTAFAYDGLGRRIGDTETASGNTVVTSYIWCGGQLCQSQNANGGIGREYYPEGEYLPASGTAIYYGPDQLGSVRDAYVTSPLISMVQAYDYDPLGNPIAVPVSGPYADFHYAGLFWHSGAGLALSRTRPYQPAIGRWLARDPLAEDHRPGRQPLSIRRRKPNQFRGPDGIGARGQPEPDPDSGAIWAKNKLLV